MIQFTVVSTIAVCFVCGFSTKLWVLLCMASVRRGVGGCIVYCVWTCVHSMECFLILAIKMDAHAHEISYTHNMANNAIKSVQFRFALFLFYPLCICLSPTNWADFNRFLYKYCFYGRYHEKKVNWKQVLAIWYKNLFWCCSTYQS